MVGRLVEVRGLEPETTKNVGDLQLEVVAVLHAEAFLKVAVAMQRGFVFAGRQGLVTDTMLEVVHFGLHVEQGLEGEARFVNNRTAAMHEAVLRQVSNRQGVGADDLSFIGLIESGQHPEQRCFSGAIRPAQSHTIAVANLPRDVVEQDASAELFVELTKVDHALDDLVNWLLVDFIEGLMDLAI